MSKPALMEKRQRLQKDMMKTFQNELQQLNSQLQSILIDDMVTAFYNRLDILEKIQNKQ
jgi:hypothetical protein